MKDKDIYKALAKEYRQGPIWVFSKSKSYAACVSAGRKITNTPRPKKSLMELLINTIRKPRDSKD